MRNPLKARGMSFQAGTIVVFDRGYADFGWWAQLSRDKVFFVTRAKVNVACEVAAEHAVPPGKKVLRDESIRFTTPKAKQDHPELLRRVTLWDEASGKKIQFLTNNFKLSSATIAAIYKDRWEIELFFKAIKQNLKIKTFLGTTANAVMTQIWTALIAMLLLKYLKHKAKFHWSLSNLLALLRMSLFSHRDLYEWLERPFAVPPDILEAEQLVLAFA